MVRHRGVIGFFAALAVVAALVAVVAAGAAADNLCNEGPNGANECPAGKAFGVGQVFELEATKPDAVSSVLGDIECASSKMKVELTELKAGAAAVGEVKELTFVAACEDAAAEACPMTAKGLPWTIKISQLGGGNAGIVISKGGANMEIEIKCGARVPCLYGEKEFKPAMTGGNPAKIVFNEAWKRFAGPCGAIKFEAEYDAKVPTAVWATK